MSAALTTASKLTPSARSGVMAVIEQSCGPAACDAISVVIYGEEILRAPANDSGPLGERVLMHIQDDAATREAGTRHAYVVRGMRDASVVFSETVRVSGGNAQGGGLAALEPTTQGALKMMLRHQEATMGLFIKSHAVTIDGLHAENLRKSERIEALEEQNDRLRVELRTALEGGRADLARAEQEKARTELLVHTGRQLLRYMPHVLRAWFPIDDEGADKKGDAAGEEKPIPAPAELVRALAAITDEQLEQTRDVLTDQQRSIVARARAGEKLSKGDAVALADDLSDEATERLMRVLRPDQVEAIVSAMAAIDLSGKKG